MLRWEIAAACALPIDRVTGDTHDEMWTSAAGGQQLGDSGRPPPGRHHPDIGEPCPPDGRSRGGGVNGSTSFHNPSTSSSWPTQSPQPANTSKGNQASHKRLLTLDALNL